MTPRLRALLLLAAAALTVGSAYPKARSVANETGKARISDPEVYSRILSRLHDREPYYDVVGSELRMHSYATVEVFNWRTPLLWRGLALVPAVVRHGMLIGLTVVVSLAAIWTAIRNSTFAGLVTGIATIGAGIVLAAPQSVAMGEVWAGELMALSVCAYANGRDRAGFSSGLLAIFVRELVAPYTLLCAIVAARRRKWREVLAWFAGGVAYTAYYGLHLSQVWAHRLPTDRPSDGSWVAWGGLTFLLSAVQWNALLIRAPRLLVGLALSLIVSGILGARTPVHVQLASATYVVLFLFIGQPFDHYWGLLAWPTWMLACGFGAQAIADAVRNLTTNDRMSHSQGTS
jgi:hypothetical protein